MKSRIIFLTIILTLLLGVFYSLNSNNFRNISDKPKVAATIFPLYDIVRNIAGDEVDTVLLLPPGASPHTFDPSPADLRALAGSHTLFAVGHGLDNWAMRMADSAGITEIVIVDKNIDLLEADDDHDDEDEDEHDEDENDNDEYNYDPHYWLSVKNAIKIADQVRDQLTIAFPQSSAEFDANYQLYVQRLEMLDEQITSELSELGDPSIATFHNAFAYFAKDYPVTIAAVFEEFPGREPTARYISEFRQEVIRNNIRVVFAEPQFSPNALTPIANDIGVSLSTLDPLGGVEGRDAYESMMIYNVNQVIDAYR